MQTNNNQLLNKLLLKHSRRLFNEETVALGLPDDVKEKILTHGHEYVSCVESIKLQRKILLKSAILEKGGIFDEYDARSLDFMLEYMSGEDETILALVADMYGELEKTEE